MKKIHMIYVTYFCFLMTSHQLYAQSKLTGYPKIEIQQYYQGDTTVLFYPEIYGLEVILPKDPTNSSWYSIDTNYRDIISLSGKHYLIDSLLYSNYLEYAGRYYFGVAYEVVKHKYYVVNFYNEYQQGTMIQPCFMVLAKKENGFERMSIYMITDIEDNSGQIEESVIVYEQNGELQLNGINIELLSVCFAQQKESLQNNQLPIESQ